jgi:predicted phage terminase large subunit-like protein
MALSTEDILRFKHEHPAEFKRITKKVLCEKKFSEFVKAFWSIVEPHTPLVWNWTMDAVTEHLQAVNNKQIKRLIINIPPGFSKSLLTNVFFPAWEWTRRPQERYLCVSYSQLLTIRDNRRFLRLISSAEYQELWSVKLDQESVVNILNSETGWKVASSIGGSVTGQRGSRILLDDPNNVSESESKVILESTNMWIRETMSDRLSNMVEDAIICIQQRTAETDVTGTLLDMDDSYVHLMIPMEHDTSRHCVTCIGWEDPRIEDGELAFPERFPAGSVDHLKMSKGPYAYAAQYMQLPAPRGGGIIKSEWWQVWPPVDPSQPIESQQIALQYPEMDYIICVCDTAYTVKEENDPSACIVFGTFALGGKTKIMMMEAWRGYLEFHELKEKIYTTCMKRRVDTLVIEGKASGKSVIQELYRQVTGGEFNIVEINPDGDKVSRVHSIISLLAAGIVYAPDRKWADDVILECSNFPKGKHDDYVDCVSMGLSYLRKTGIALMPTEEKLRQEHDLFIDNVSTNELPYDI